MKLIYSILLAAIPVAAFGSGHGDPPPSGRVTTFEDMKNILFYLVIAFGIVATILSYLQQSMNQALKRRLRAKNHAEQPDDVIPAGSIDVAPPVPDDIHLAKVRAELEAARDVLLGELYKVQRRSFLNLAIGILISVAAIGLLLFQLSDAPVKNLSWEGLFAAYFPRFIACAFIELLAFFFLRLYRAGIAEMRVYGVDLKELTLKQVAIEIVWTQESADSPRSKFALELLRQEPKQTAATKDDSEIDLRRAFEAFQKMAGVLVEKTKSKPDKKGEE